MNKGYYYNEEGYLFYSKYVAGVEIITMYGEDKRRQPWQKLLYKHTTTGEIKTAGEWEQDHLLSRRKGINCSTDWRYGLIRYKGE